ncbi:MAG: excinuclease ABC subunit UvrA [Candidatus Scatomorpha sp.]|jgi:excinuclease ABC subunit A
MRDKIYIKGARENNLKNIELEIPRDKLVVITGISGSGKSSLAFDTLYAEGQRRYVESLSSYARMFLGQMRKPDVDYIDGLSPAISIDQKTSSRNPRSTVGTVTEIYDYLRLLWARVGHAHCPICGKEIKTQTIDQISDSVLKLPQGTRFMVLSPLVRGRKGEHAKVFEEARASGFVRVRVDGEIRGLDEEIVLDKNKKHHIELVVDRLSLKEKIERRLSDSLETAAKLSNGLVIINTPDDGKDRLYSQNYACEDCGINMEELSPRFFSFNSPQGACPLCAGLGSQLRADASLIIPNDSLSLREGAVDVPGWNNFKPDSVTMIYFEALAEKYNFSLNTKYKDLPESIKEIILYGTGSEKLELKYKTGSGYRTYRQPFEGILNNVERRYRETQSSYMREEYEALMLEHPCPECQGKRLKKEALSVYVGGLNIHEFCEMPVSESLKFIEDLKLSEKETVIAAQIRKEIISRLEFLNSVGLSYLTLSRSASTLSGGESQRIRLATQIGSSLMGVLYILDEPSIGLHRRDSEKLIRTLKGLRDLGNSVIVVEHDKETMRNADFIVDMGPGAGAHGGEIVAIGPPEAICKNPKSLTGQYLTGKKKIPLPKTRREITDRHIKIIGAEENNLKKIDVEIPLGTLTCVSGVSGSGKSSLVNEIIYKALAAERNRAKLRPGKFVRIEGSELIDKVICIDQSPIGRTPRSNPATYTGLFDGIRELYSMTADARLRGYDKGRFSFNVKGGRCEACRGDGSLRIEMHFLPDVYVDCDVCKGKRYNRETLEVRYKGKNISDVLDMTVDEALDFFSSIPKLVKKLSVLRDVGLGYMKLGQSSVSLSGGEAQRVKLATELSKRSTGNTLYVLDEPTTGLHEADVARLVEILHRLTDSGNTVIVIEHDLDVLKVADYIIDLGPEGGDAGGELLFAGRPEDLLNCPRSYTGKYMKEVLE